MIFIANLRYSIQFFEFSEYCRTTALSDLEKFLACLGFRVNETGELKLNLRLSQSGPRA